MHTYLRDFELGKDEKEVQVFRVGYYYFTGREVLAATEWHTLSTHKTEEGAMRRVNYLNGGAGSTCPGE